MLEGMIRRFDAEQLHSIIDQIFPFQDTRAAFLHLQSSRHIGKVSIAFHCIEKIACGTQPTIPSRSCREQHGPLHVGWMRSQ